MQVYDVGDRTSARWVDVHTVNEEVGYSLSPLGLRFVADDGRIYEVIPNGNGLTVRCPEGSLAVRPESANGVAVYQDHTELEPIAFVSGTGFVGGRDGGDRRDS